jgi:hypothetical protein
MVNNDMQILGSRRVYILMHSEYTEKCTAAIQISTSQLLRLKCTLQPQQSQNLEPGDEARYLYRSVRSAARFSQCFSENLAANTLFTKHPI